MSLFASESSICKSAIQMGISFNSFINLVQVTLNYPFYTLFGNNNYHILSEKKSINSKTFTISKPNSCAL